MDKTWTKQFSKCKICNTLIKHGFNKEKVKQYHNSNIDITEFSKGEQEFIYEILEQERNKQ